MITPSISVKGKITPSIKLKGELHRSVDIRNPELENLEITPGIEEQTFKSANYYGYDEVKVKEVTADIDENIKPEYIKAGVSILEVEGSFEGIDTSDATVTADDMLEGKTAYANNKQITGTIQEYDGSFSGDVAEIEENAIMADLVQDVDKGNILKSLLVKIPDTINTSALTSTNSMFSGCKNLLEVPMMDTSKSTNGSYMFNECPLITTIPLINTSKFGTTTFMFYNCVNLQTIPKIDTSNVTDMYRMFGECSSLTTIPELNTEKVTNLRQMFYRCVSLIGKIKLNIPEVTTMDNTFYNCKMIEEIQLENTNKLVNLNGAFMTCSSLKKLNQFNCSEITNISSVFSNCWELTNLGGFSNLGKAYTYKKSNYSSYGLTLNNSSKLTHDSLINVINNLYDLNLTYDVANGGTLYTQQLILGSTNKTKLTPEEIAIATSKGWTVG